MEVLYWTLSSIEQYTAVETTCGCGDMVALWVAAADEGQVYQPMFFTHERPFEEFFCICILLLNKTWKEMKATSADFIKVSYCKI